MNNSLQLTQLISSGAMGTEGRVLELLAIAQGDSDTAVRAESTGYCGSY